jgi:hypothetical protein
MFTISTNLPDDPTLLQQMLRAAWRRIKLWRIAPHFWRGATPVAANSKADGRNRSSSEKADFSPQAVRLLAPRR